MKQKKFKGFIIGGVIVVLLAAWMIITYNALIRKEEKVKQQWGEVQNTYQRRLNLVPNLVAVVKGVSDFEQSTLEKIAEARSRAQSGLGGTINGENYRRQAELQDSLAASANRLIVIVENYPVLKGTDAYRGLQTQLVGTERRIKVSRDDFNKAVADYNRSVRSFPTNLIAGLFGFKKKEGFAADTGAEKRVEIKFK